MKLHQILIGFAFVVLSGGVFAAPPKTKIIPDLPPKGAEQKANLPKSVEADASAESLLRLDGLAIRVVPRNLDTSLGLGVKTVNVSLRGERVIATWSSLDRQRVSSDVFTTDKIKVIKGVVDCSPFREGMGILPPLFWRPGYRKADGLLPLWVNPMWITESKERRVFLLPLLSADRGVIEGIADTHYEKVLYLRNLYEHYLPGGKLDNDGDLRSQDKKAMKEFAADFFTGSVIAKTKAEIFVNKEKKSLPALIIGNAYFQVVVLEDANNPLILSLTVFSDKVPEIFKKTFEHFKKHMEFVVTQVAF